jgi:DNA-binding NarL/FixJ family response regulator
MLAAIDNVTIAGEARTASEAIAGIDATRPNVVLLDLNLGDSSGMDVLRAVSRKLPVASVIVLTNHAEPQYRRACLKAGARHFLDKSTQFDCVRTVISNLEANPSESRP